MFQSSNYQNNNHGPFLNGTILVVCKILQHVVSSATESETTEVFYNFQLSISIRCMLEALNHSQSEIPVKTDDPTVNGFVYDNINKKRSKSWDMRYHWRQEKNAKKEFNIFYDKGTDNNADHFTKHHPAQYHLHVQKSSYCVRDA